MGVLEGAQEAEGSTLDPIDVDDVLPAVVAAVPTPLYRGDIPPKILAGSLDGQILVELGWSFPHDTPRSWALEAPQKDR